MLPFLRSKINIATRIGTWLHSYSNDIPKRINKKATIHVKNDMIITENSLKTPFWLKITLRRFPFG